MSESKIQSPQSLNAFGARIEALRRARHMTQAELARSLMVCSQTISKWECGRGYPDISLLPELARALGCTVDDLFFTSRK